tara:strand:+ start:85 stop:378 length:294 start_codon:yes stop_codon:yes gene_type:complete
VINTKQFNELIDNIQPFLLPFYIDEYSSKPYEFKNDILKSGEYAIQVFGECFCSYGGHSFNIKLVLWDKDNQEVLVSPDQYKNLKISVIKNIVTNGR